MLSIRRFSNFQKIFLFFAVWRVTLFFIAFLATIFITNFGGRFPYFDKVLIPTGLPSWVWGFGNFDGVHYLKIAQEGYRAEYSQAFFPLFPVLISGVGLLFSLSLNYYLSYFAAGLLISNAFFVIALFYLYKLFRLDFDEHVSLRATLIVFLFPTAFYFGAIYTESLFLFFTVLSFYFLRKKNYLLSGIFIGLSSATRLIGILLILAYLVELILDLKKGTLKSRKKYEAIVGLFLSFGGLFSYIYFLSSEFGKPLYFLSAQTIFGIERSVDKVVLLPQVLFRYFKIFYTVPFNTLAFFNAFIEIAFTLGAFTALILFFKKIRFSYWIFMFTSLLLPTLTGTLISMPRFSLFIFLLFPYLTSLGKFTRIIITIFVFLQILFVSLYSRGYWIS